jgi:hypothetical protein
LVVFVMGSSSSSRICTASPSDRRQQGLMREAEALAARCPMDNSEPRQGARVQIAESDSSVLSTGAGQGYTGKM